MPKLFALYPVGTGGYRRMWLYLMGTQDGAVKVGMTSLPRSRMCVHRRTFGRRVAWVHLFPEASYAVANSAERRTVAAFSEHGQRRGRTEIFDGLTRDRAIAIARDGLSEARALYHRYGWTDDIRPGGWRNHTAPPASDKPSNPKER